MIALFDAKGNLSSTYKIIANVAEEIVSLQMVGVAMQPGVFLPWRKTTGMCLPEQNFMTLSWNKMVNTIVPVLE